MTPVYYNTAEATSDRQDTANASLAQILTAIQALGGDPATLQAILTALGPLATASAQATGNTSLASILAALPALSTAAKQDIGNASLASIDAKIGSNTAVITSVTQTPSTVLLLTANSNRKGFSLYNDTGAKCYVAMAATASQTAFSVLLAPNSGYEPIQTAVYKGAIAAIWASGTTGAMRVTEFT